MRSSIRKRYLRYYCAWMIVPSSLRRETPANALGSSRRAQVFILCDRRGYDRSIAGLGAVERSAISLPTLIVQIVLLDGWQGSKRSRGLAAAWYCTTSIGASMRY